MTLSAISGYLGMFWDGFLVTASVSALSIAGSFLIGVIVAFGAVSRRPFLRKAARGYIGLFRNIPFIVQVFFFYFGLPEIGVYIDAFTTGTMALSIAVGAYAADVLRSGIENVDTGVIEAAEVSGLSRFKIYRRIIMPIALRVSLRPLGSVFINLVLTTSILSTITLNELTGNAKIVASDTFRPFEVYFFLLLFYCVLTYLLSLLINLWHRRLNRFMRGAE
ncbi:amino acid ABC transporter permease [Thalassospira sp.]|uniref:amino acid ABC transporter permease n=1 Tax=Thalassospira sp. TaxID=1912094 RepID=UPI003AA8365C